MRLARLASVHFGIVSSLHSRHVLVVRERGRGAHVGTYPRGEAVAGVDRGVLENLLVMDLRERVMVLEIAYVPASAEIANAHACPLGQTTQRAVRPRHRR